MGATGPAGPDGLVGPAGPRGATGATGAAGATDYGYVYNLGAQVVPIESDVTFDSNGLLCGFVHLVNSPEIQVTVAGIYLVSFSVSGVEPSQFSLMVDGAAVPGGTYGSGAGTQQNNGQAIVQLGVGDILTLRNHSSAAAVALQILAGGTETNVNASLSFEQIG
jgi:hypothetical protein